MKIFNNLFLGLTIKEKVLFATRLAFLIRSGTPIIEALRVLRKQATSSSKSKVLDQVIADVSNGQFLSSSLAKFEHIFDDFAVNLIKIGEESGTLDENLAYLAEEMKKKQALRRKVVGAMVYPVFIVIATLGMAALLTIYIFPKILPIFASLSAKLPVTTRILIWTSDFLKANGLYLVAGFAGIIILIPVLLQMPKVRFFAHRMVLKVPLVGSISKNYHLANLCRTLSILLKSDIRIVRAFAIAAETSSSLVYKKELHKISESVTRGDRITAHMDKNPRLFPNIMTHTIDIGEATGKLDETLMFLSEMYETDVEELTKNLSTVLEPALMIFMGIIVGFIAISIITPIYEITQYLQPR
ncbi:MAG: type II secretion system F family protein [Candidatus Yanofskybacteria bacterium]|nr:type II secretion system F family protein [Candidatus Yanofskybacteria bacterium]